MLETLVMLYHALAYVIRSFKVTSAYQPLISYSSCYFQADVRSNTEDWSSLGMHGNHSGPLVCESTISEDQLIGPYGKNL